MIIGLLAGLNEANASLTLDVSGRCPTRPELARHLRLRLAPAAQRLFSGWRLVVRRYAVEIATTAVELRDAKDQLVIQRSIGGNDCNALSETIAAILQAYLIRIESLATLRHRRWTLQMALFGGAEVSLMPGLASAIAQLSVGLYRADWRLFPRVSLLASTGASQHGRRESVRRWHLMPSLDAALRLRRGAWRLVPAVGLGLSISTVRAISLPRASSRRHVDPTLNASFRGTLMLSEHWGIVASLASAWFMRAHDYIIEGSGSIAQSPRFSLRALVGVELLIK